MSFFEKDVQVIEVVRTRLLHRGDGSKENPHRYVTQYWAFDGELLAERDPAKEAVVMSGGQRVAGGTASSGSREQAA